MPKKPAIKRIGILTAGGDCPGLNAAIRAVGKACISQFGIEVMGIYDGFRGLAEGQARRLGLDEFSGLLTLGGTIPATGPWWMARNSACSATANWGWTAWSAWAATAPSAMPWA